MQNGPRVGDFSENRVRARLKNPDEGWQGSPQRLMPQQSETDKQPLDLV